MNFRSTDEADLEGTGGEAEAQEPKGKPTETLWESPWACVHTACGARFQELQVTPTSGKTSWIPPEASFKVGAKPADTEITS